LITQFETFLATKLDELARDFRQVFSDPNYQEQLRHWTSTLEQRPLRIDIQDILYNKLKETSNNQEKLFYKASMDLGGTSLSRAFDDKLRTCEARAELLMTN
jgi:hypothetical protein